MLTIFLCEIHKKVLFRDDQTPGHLLHMILNLPANIHIAVRHTCVVLIGDLASWISMNDEVLSKLFIS